MDYSLLYYRVYCIIVYCMMDVLYYVIMVDYCIIVGVLGLYVLWGLYCSIYLL